MTDTFASRPVPIEKKAYRTPKLSDQQSERCSPREAWFQHRPGERSPVLDPDRDEFPTLPECRQKFWQDAEALSPAPSPRTQPRLVRLRSAPADWRFRSDSDLPLEILGSLPMPNTVVDTCWRQTLRQFSASEVNRPM